MQGYRGVPSWLAQPLFEIGSHTVAQAGTELEVIFYLSFLSTEITGECPCPQSASVGWELESREQRLEELWSGREGLGRAGG